MPGEVLIPIGMLAVFSSMMYPLIRAWARRIEAKGAGNIDAAQLDELRDELRHLHERLDAMEMEDPRVTELEERLDFAERVLAQQHRPTLEPPNVSEVPT